MANQILSSSFRFYQSANADAESIKEDFLIRLKEFEIIMEDIRRNPMKGSVQHYLLLGRRGSGKSTLLKRIQVEVDTDKKLSKTHIAINLAEEQANIYKLHDLWEEIIQELEDRGIAVEKPEWDENEQAYSRSLFTAIHKAIEKSNKKIILLLDNIDRIFENLQSDAALLREYLLNFDDIKIIGGSTKMTEHFWKYNQPFYEFFRVLELKPLTGEEIKKLLLYWSEKLTLPQLKDFVEKRTGQLETVRILTDGLPRTLQFFVNILLTRTQETGYEYLRLIMDHATPLYQERLNGLPPAQRKVVLKMAFLWEAGGAKEIAAVTHMDNKVVSAQLKQLCDKGITEKIETKTKNHLYRLAERFFNLWLIFTQGSPQEKRKAKCLTIFLENFYEAEELKNLAFSHLVMIKDGRMAPNKAALLTKAFAQSKHISFGMRDQLISSTLELKGVDKELAAQLPFTTKTIWEKIEIFVGKQEWNSALKIVENVEQEDGIKDLLLGRIYFSWKNFNEAEKYFLIAKSKGFQYAAKLLVLIYINQQKFDLAEKYYESIINKEDVDFIDIVASLYKEAGKSDLAEKYYLLAVEKGNVDAINNIAIVYDESGKTELAEKYYLLAIDKGNIDALNNIATLYDELGKADLAEKYYMMAIERGYLDASNNLAVLYSEQKKFDSAEKYYKMAIEEGNIDALNNIAILYKELQKKELAEKYYVMAIERGHLNASNNLAVLYSEQKKFDLAEKYYKMAIEEGSIDAFNNLASLYKELKKIDLAEKYYLIAIEKGNTDAFDTLAGLYIELEKFDLAEKYYLIAIEKGEINGFYNLAILYENQKKIDLAEKYYKLSIDNGDTDSLFGLADFYHNQKKLDLAEKYYLLSIKEGDIDAFCGLGNLYQDQQSFELSEKYYLLSIEKNDTDAMFYLGTLYYDYEKFDLAEKYFLLAVEKGDTDAWDGLGDVYRKKNEFKLAEKYYQLAIENGIRRSLFGIANLYYNNNLKKDKSLSYINEHFLLNPSDELSANLRIAIHLWVGEIKLAHGYFMDLVKEKKYTHFSTTLIHLLIHKQINFVLNLFSNEEYGNDFMQQFQPVYYAAGILNNKDENFVLKIPPELLETVNVILEDIRKGQELFYGNK
jgi:TPR repeat protein